MKSSSSDGPRSPALSEFWLSPIVTPWFVVSARPDESTRTRSSASLAGLNPAVAGLPLLPVALRSDSVLAPTLGSGGSTLCPGCGVRDASPYSLGFAALNGNASATISVAAIFAVAASCTAAERRDGPLVVPREEVFVAPAADFAEGFPVLRGFTPRAAAWPAGRLPPRCVGRFDFGFVGMRSPLP